MTFKKPTFNNVKKSTKKEPEGRISLWAPVEEKTYVISGIVDIEGKKYRVFIYENNQKKMERSPDYYGSLFLEEVPEEKEERVVKPAPAVNTNTQEEEEENEEELF
jgi:hypothetical protein